MTSRFLIFFISLFLTSTALSATTSANSTDVNDPLKQCFATCIEISQPGWEIKKCVANCQKKYGQSAQSNQWVADLLVFNSEWCETYEEDCERDDDDPWGGL